MPLLQLVLLGLVFISDAQQDAIEYAAVCDAGSTGTRLYVFGLNIKNNEAKAIFVKKTKPGLSSYADAVHDSVPPLLKLLKEGAEQVPEELRQKVPLAIFGTAGVRLLHESKQEALWDAVRSGLKNDPTYPFDSKKLEARTISGTEEGLWAVYNANYLTGRMSHELLSNGKGVPLGLMDLGGSSTQIAIPAGKAVTAGARFGDDALVHSYLGFGMTYIREQMRKSANDGKDVVCYMRGATVEAGLVGTGNAAACRNLIRDMMQQKVRECHASETAEKPCLGDLAQFPEAVAAISGRVDFYAVAGMTYVVDFVHWWLGLKADAGVATKAFRDAYPRASLDELRQAVDIVCADTFNDSEIQKHKYTGSDNSHYRCFQANYILVLLGDMYGFASDGRSISFLLDVEGEDLEWPLGAALARRASAKGGGDEL